MTTPTQPAPVQPVQPTHAAPKRTTVCGIIGVVLGVLALILSFIPIINNLAAIIGVIGLVLSIIGIVGVFRGKKHGRGLAITAAVLCALSIVITLGMQVATTKAIDDAVKESKGIDTSQQTDAGDTDDTNSQTDKADTAEPKGDQDTEGDIEGAHVKIVSAVTGNNDYEGKPTVMVTYEWTNTTTKNNSFLALASAQAFQNGAELDTAIYTTDPQGYVSGSDWSELQPNASGTVTVGYVLSDNSPVTIEVSALFSLTDESKVTRTFTL